MPPRHGDRPSGHRPIRDHQEVRLTPAPRSRGEPGGCEAYGGRHTRRPAPSALAAGRKPPARGKAHAWEQMEPRLEELRGPFAAECEGWAGRPDTFEGFTALLHEWGDVTREAARRGRGGSPCRSGRPGTWRVPAGRRRCDGLVRGRARPHHRRHHRPAVATDSWSVVIRSAINPASAWPSTVARAVRPRCPRYRGQDFTMPPPARDGQPQCRVFALRILESPAHALKVPRSAGPQRQGNRDADGCREARGAGHQDLPPP
ncbi:hypothetical protein C5746_38895 [Streptomyces atratus]|uniref:Uncharacterized protein n=1 Tax=Streptomyces atratus TaxID=1893 RepID=A0A2Z5JNH6_STRAR|nr:hypothetical protein C5746_38895 [Streptomyces atratus]